MAGEVQDYYRTIAEYYDAELSHRGDEAFWRALGRTYGGRHILEIGAGSGRVTGLLAAAGARVVALDLSPEMVMRARERLAGRRNVALLVADMRHVALRRRFDLIVAANDPFAHLTADADRAAALRVVAGHLAPAGRFVLDALWWRADHEAAAARPEGRERERAATLDGRPLRIRERWRCDPESRHCDARYEYHAPDRDAVVAEFHARYWSMPELRAAFAEAGLRLERCWGDYERAPWNERESSRLVVQARLDV